MNAPQSVAESTCKYLFGKEADVVFENLKVPNHVNKKKFVDECLELCMRVHHHILSKKDAFILLNPMAFNNQCHLYALRAAQIKKMYAQKTEAEKMERNEENRFIHLSFFLTYSLITDTNFYIQGVEKALKEMGVKKVGSRKQFTAFLRDEGRGRERASRTSLNQTFERHTKETFKRLKEANVKTRMQISNPILRFVISLILGIYNRIFPELPESSLYKELDELAHENLQMISSRGEKEGYLYTLPKLAGVAYMVDTLAKEKIPFVIKVKVITDKGVAGVIVRASEEIQKNEQVLVFETIATDGSFTVPHCREEAQRCPHYFYRYSDKKKRHPENESCFSCKKTSADLTPFRERLELAMKSPTKMFDALGSDFVREFQKEFTPFFHNKAKYPLLSKRFAEAITNIEQLGLSMNNPKTFSVCHVHMDSGANALSEKLVLDSFPEDFLKERGII